MTLDHPDYQALLAAVLADPADDVPRLILADWLEENAKEVECGRCKRRSDWHDALTDDGRCLDCKGSGRVPNGFAEYAEFIRVQVELATKSDCPDWCDPDPAKCRVEALRERERTLFKDSGPCWWNYLPGSWRATVGADVSIETAEGWKYLIRRGFVDEIRCPLRAWVGDGTVGGIGPELVRRHPLTRVTFSDREPYESGYATYIESIRGEVRGWVRSTPGQLGQPDYLPPALFDLLDLPTYHGYTLTVKTAPSRQAALDALSAACLGWAKSGAVGVPSHG